MSEGQRLADGAGADAGSAAPVGELVRAANLELIPLKSAREHLAALPAGSRITVTCSPKFGLPRTLELTEAAIRAGHTVVPHLAARMVAHRSELAEFVKRVVDLGVDDLYVIGGDAKEPVGGYRDAAGLLADLAGLDHGLRRIGVGCYPEGHPHIPDEALRAALLAKQKYATYMVSQLCFDPGTLTSWLTQTRAAGVRLPLRLGVAAPVAITKLAELSLRIGVGQSLRYLTKQQGVVTNLVLGRSYAPERLLDRLAPQFAAPELAIEGLHVFTFNQVEATVAWQQRITART